MSTVPHFTLKPVSHIFACLKSQPYRNIYFMSMYHAAPYLFYLSAWFSLKQLTTAVSHIKNSCLALDSFLYQDFYKTWQKTLILLKEVRCKIQSRRETNVPSRDDTMSHQYSMGIISAQCNYIFYSMPFSDSIMCLLLARAKPWQLH